MSNQKRKTKGAPDAVDVHVGKRLKIRRSLLGLSQEKLADATDITFQQIQKYEHGMNRISAGRLFQFSKILEVPISYFFENMGGEAQGSGIFGFSDQDQDGFIYQDITQNKETIDLLKVYYAIKDPDMRKEVLRFCKVIADKTKPDQE